TSLDRRRLAREAVSEGLNPDVYVVVQLHPRKSTADIIGVMHAECDRTCARIGTADLSKREPSRPVKDRGDGAVERREHADRYGNVGIGRGVGREGDIALVLSHPIYASVTRAGLRVKCSGV